MSKDERIMWESLGSKAYAASSEKTSYPQSYPETATDQEKLWFKEGWHDARMSSLDEEDDAFWDEVDRRAEEHQEEEMEVEKAPTQNQTRLFQVNLDVFGIPENEYEATIVEIENFLKSKGLDHYIHIGEEMTDPVLIEKYFEEIDSEEEEIQKGLGGTTSIYEVFDDDVKIVNTGCTCGNPELGFDCTCRHSMLHPGDKNYGCEYCGIYTASRPRCNKCSEEK